MDVGPAGRHAPPLWWRNTIVPWMADRLRDHDRVKAMIGVAVLHGLLGYALTSALGIQVPIRERDDLKLFALTPENPPIAREPVRPRSAREQKEGAAAPPNLKAEPTPVVAPPPEVRLAPPPPVIAAPVAGLGGDPSAGAAEVPGPGTGAAGKGAGTGGGGNGEEDGDYTPPHRLRGRLKDADYPREAGEAGLGQTITVRFTVETTGRVTECAVIESSGNAILDEATCRAIERRYRYKPSRDSQDIAVPSIVVETHVWGIDDR